LKNIIHHIKLFGHFEFSRKKYFQFYFYPKKRKVDENSIFENSEKYKHFRRHLEYSRHLELSRLVTNFLQYNSVRSITYPKIKTFHSVVLLKNHKFLCKKSAILNFSAILRKKNFVKDEQLAKF
jgi:hypothetical protein